MFSMNMQVGFGMPIGNLLSSASQMGGNAGFFAGVSGPQGSFVMGAMAGTDRVGFSPDAMSGFGGSNFMNPLMNLGCCNPMMGGFNNGMGMIPGMMPGFGSQGGVQNQNMMQMMMMLMQMLMMLMQQQGMGGGMPMGMGGMPMGMGGMPMGMGGFPSGGFGRPVSMPPYGHSRPLPPFAAGSPSGSFPGVGGVGGGSAIGGGPGQYGPDAARWIDNYLGQRGSPAAGRGAGDMFLKYGKEYNVDPMVLLAISQHETNHGKLGVGMRKMLGVGAFDANPNGRTKFDGLENQIRYGASTFARLRERGGSNADAPVAQQLAAANRAGWATDRNWHNKVMRHYNQITRDAGSAGVSARGNVGAGSSGSAAVDLARRYIGQDSWKIKGQMPNFTAAGGRTNNCADFVSAALQSTGRLRGHEINVRRLEQSIQRQGYVRVPASQARPGDVWINHSRGHTELVSRAGGTHTIGSNNIRPGHQVISERAKSTTSGVYYQLRRQ